MKIAHVVESFGGGTISFVILLTKYLPEHEHIIIHGQRLEEVDPEVVKKRFEQKVTFIPWPNTGRELSLLQDAKALISLVRVLGNVKPEVVHLHSSKAGFLGRLAGKILGLKHVIYTSHAVSFIREDISIIKKQLFILLEQVADSFGGRVVACSDSEKQRFLDIGIDAIGIANGVEHLGASEIRVNHEEGLITIGTIGRVTTQKNPSLFNEIATVCQGLPQVKFLWIGNGELSSQLISSNCELTGWLTPTQAQIHLQKIDIYLSTSLWEGLPLSVLEAMQAGKPLLLSDCVGNVDCIDGTNGVVYTSNEEAVQTIIKWVTDGEHLAQMGHSSKRLFAQKFRIEKCVAAYNALYHDKLSSSF